MGRYLFTARRAISTIVATFAALLAVGASGAQAVVINDSGTLAGVSLLPSVRGGALPTGVSALTSSNACTDPWLSSDFGGPAMPSAGLCYRGGAVMHKNETFALTWDQHRSYWAQTRGYVEQFLRDVADGSGQLGSPYALTTQYSDASGRALNASLYGGGCIDYGNTGGSYCEFGAPTVAGHDFPGNGCTPGGDSFVALNTVPGNSTCLTDNQIQSEVATMVTQTGILGRTAPGYTPVVNLLLPPGVEACLDASNKLCSVNGYLTPPPPGVSGNSVANGASSGLPAGTYLVEVTYTTASGESLPSSPQLVTLTGVASSITVTSPPFTAGVTGWNVYMTGANGSTFFRQNGGTPIAIGTDFGPAVSVNSGGGPPTQPAFCSYHSQVNVGGTEVVYVVQPWSAGTTCDEPDVTPITPAMDVHALSVAVGQRLVSPLSQSHIAAIVNPGLNGWVNNDGSEIEDNSINGITCQPLPDQLDRVNVGNSSQNPYYLQRESNNAAALALEPFTYFGCAPIVNLTPSFVAPSAVNQGDEVQFDGSATASTLLIPNHGYVWSFGDGSANGVGPSVVHAFTKAGTYAVTLTATDRGGNKVNFSQYVTVLDANGQPAPPPGNTGSHGGAPAAPFRVHLQLLPEALRNVLNRGLALRVKSNYVANGLVTVSISRRSARAAHITVGRALTVVIGRGTVSQVRNGSITLHLHLSPKMAAKLHRLRHLTVTVRLALVPSVGHRLAIVVAGRY